MYACMSCMYVCIIVFTYSTKHYYGLLATSVLEKYIYNIFSRFHKNKKNKY